MGLSGLCDSEIGRLLLLEDRVVLRLLRGGLHSGVSRRELLAALAAVGYAPSGLPLLIGTSPLLVRIGSGRYALTAAGGADPD